MALLEDAAMAGSESIKRTSDGQQAGRRWGQFLARLATPQTAWAIAGLAVTAAILAYFHDRSWWPPDDGTYGYVAQRILAGDVLNGTVHDIHAGYVNFLHVAAFWMFGEDLLSLRYPLAALTLLQSFFAFRLLLPRCPAYAALGAVALGALSFVLFINPSANWYALVIAFAAILLLAEAPAGDARRDVTLGALLAFAFLFRQLSGVLLAIGVLTWLLVEPRPQAAGRPLVARALASIMGVGVAGYVWSKGSVDGALMFGIWPLALIGIALARTRLSDAAALKLIALMALGGALATLPLVVYHIAHGSLRGWVDDTFLVAAQLSYLDVIQKPRYWHIAMVALGKLAQEPSLIFAAKGLFWLALLAAPPLLGLCLTIAAWRGDPRALHPLPVVASAYALTSTHFEVNIYLVFSTGLVIVALMWLFGGTARSRLAAGVAAILLTVISLLFQAGQPITRGFAAIMESRGAVLDAPEGLPGASIAMDRSDQTTYRRLLALIDANAKPGDAILALPYNPELYFLSRRRSVFDFYITALGIRSDADLAQAMQRLKSAPPPIVIHRPADKYNNWASDALMAEVKRHYRFVEQVESFDVYVLP